MVFCERCDKEFQYPWMLNRHLARKRPCKIVEIQSNDENESTIENMLNKNNEATMENVCQFCNMTFCTEWYRNKHERKCKLKDDDIMHLEQELGLVSSHEMLSKYTCRFCKNKSSSLGNAERHNNSCKAKMLYREKLIRMMDKTGNNNNKIEVQNNIQTQNNTYINNTNNITINALGNETLEHIEIQKVIEMLIKHKSSKDDSIYLISGKSVIDFHRLLMEREENRNVLVPHERRQIAFLKREGDGELKKVEIDKALDESFKNSSKHLYHTMETIKEQQGEFKTNKTQDIHECVHSMSQKGYTLGRFKEDDILKRTFKMANLPESQGNVI